MLKRGFLLLSAFLSLGMITCSNPPTNPGEDLRNVTVTVLPPDEDKESIAGEPVTVGVYLTMAKHIEEITVSFDNYDFDTTFSYDQSDKWFDTLYLTRVFPDSGTARVRATVKVRNDERSRTHEYELKILPKPFELAFDSSMTTHFLTETADTILFSIVSNRGEPDSVAAKLISDEDTSDIELDYKDLAGKIPLLLDSPGIYTLVLTLEESTFRDDTSFTISAHNQPCFADTPELTKNLVLGSSDMLNFSACADSFDNVVIEMLNSDDFSEEELKISSTEGSLAGLPFTMAADFTPAQARICTFYVAVTNGFFYDTLQVIRDVKEEVPVLAEITKQPESKEVKAGGSATIRVEATGKGLTYQWQQDQKDIPDANQTSLLVVGVTSEFDGRKYRCVVSNDAGDVSSEEAEINVLYSVTYDGNDHSEGSVPEDSAFYKAGESITLADNTGDLDRDGFTFSGWSRVAGDTTEIYSPDDTLLMGSGNLTVYAVWKKSIYDVIFNPQNGDVSTATTAVHGSLINEPDEPVRSGFRFSGWSAEQSGGTMWDFSSDTVENSMTLYANWVAVYTVTYDANGAQGTPPRDTSLHEEGAYITVLSPDSLTNSDSLFLSWSDKADSTGNEYYPGDKILVEDKDLVLYAQWTIHPTFTISYEGNQNTDGEAPEDNSRYKEGDEVTVAGAGTLEKTGHTFAGWYTDSVYTEDFYAADDVFAMPAQDMTLYAYWTDNPTYKVTYDLNGGEGTVPVDNNLYESGTEVTLKPKGDLNRDGHEFVGWETDSGQRYATGSRYTMEDSDITFFAQWTQNPIFNVTYFANSSNVTGSVPLDTNNYEESDTVLVAQPGTMKLTGHSFTGWNLSRAGDSTSYAKGAKMAMPPADVELYAQWRKNTYTVYFLDSEGGATIDSQRVIYNETAQEIEASPRDGYTFEGWFTESNVNFNFATPVTGNLTLHAQWSENPTYSVIYLPNNANVTGSAPEDNNSYEQGDSVVVKGQGSMELAGYTFDCWATTPRGNVKHCEGSKLEVDTANVPLYARWVQNPTYTVTYYANGSIVPPTEAYEENETVTVMSASGLSKTGHTFDSWNSEYDGNGTSYSPGDEFLMDAADMELFAIWKKNSYVVRFNSKGGTSVLNDTVLYLGYATEPPPPTKSRNRFAGWLLGDTNFVFSTPITRGIILEAKWDTLFAVTYSKASGDGSTGTVPVDTNLYRPDDSIKVLGNTGSLARAGYTFDGWKHGTVTRQPDTEFPMGTADIKMTVNWELNPPVIDTDPVSVSADAGDTDIIFTVSATSAVPMTYQWLKNGDPISGETSDSLKLPVVTLSDTGKYSCRVFNSTGGGESTSSEATLRVAVAPWVPGPGEIQRDGGMVLIKAAGYGFTMGATAQDSATPHVVTFTRDYWMDTTEVTKGDFETIMSAYAPSYITHYCSTGVAGGVGCNDDHPYYRSTWYDALLYCNARSIEENLTPVYSYTEAKWKTETWRARCTLLVDIVVDSAANGYRLPTEAQWEYAARSGTSTNFFWGDDDARLDSFVIWNGNSNDLTYPVASKGSNYYGLYDMMGNVLEWCFDFYGSFSSDPQVDPSGPTYGTRRVLRGGDFRETNEVFLFTTSRTGSNPIEEGFLIYTGLRVIRYR